jgi:hypothetical protein
LCILQTHELFADGSPLPLDDSPTHRGSEIEDISLWETAVKRERIQIRNHTGQAIAVMVEWTVEKKLTKSSDINISASAASGAVAVKMLREFAYNPANMLHVEPIGAERKGSNRVDLPRRTSAIVTACKIEDPTQVYCFHRLVKPGRRVTFVAGTLAPQA